MSVGLGVLILVLAQPTQSQAADPASAPSASTHRYLFVGAGVLTVLGGGMAYIAVGESDRARRFSSATGAARIMSGAHQTAATANLLFGLAGALALYGLALELMPPQAQGGG